jgi:hypothetical protein
MPLYFILIGVFFASNMTIAQAKDRKPAVEDFIGIEVEGSKTTSYGDESLFNLEQDMDKIKFSNKNENITQTEFIRKKNIDPITFIAITFSLSLPFVIWFTVMSHLRKKAQIENMNNIEVLEKYRKTREKTNEDRIKKAS